MENSQPKKFNKNTDGTLNQFLQDCCQYFQENPPENELGPNSELVSGSGWPNRALNHVASNLDLTIGHNLKAWSHWEVTLQEENNHAMSHNDL